MAGKISHNILDIEIFAFPSYFSEKQAFIDIFEKWHIVLIKGHAKIEIVGFFGLNFSILSL
jgi:hypothetical protein